MIELIDVEENVGKSRYTLNSNFEELESLVCNLHIENNRQQNVKTFLNSIKNRLENVNNLILNIKDKWNNFADTVYTLKGFWPTPITLIKKNPFINGRVNKTLSKNDVTVYKNSNTYTNNQHFNYFYLVLNHDPRLVNEHNLYNIEVGRHCFKIKNNKVIDSNCLYSINLDDMTCNNVYSPIDLNNAYKCNLQYRLVYYLVSDE